MRQLAFDLPVRAARGREAFFVAPSNAVALAAVEGWRGWPDGRLVLVGPEGAGKSHLAQVWLTGLPDRGAAVAGAHLAPGDVPALAGAGAVLVEGADDVAGRPEAERALFHLLNLLAAQRGHVLLTARAPVRDWGLRLPDLRSRLEAATLARLEPPDTALLAAAMVKQFADRQIVVPPAVIGWTVPRIERSLAAVGRAVALMDALALERGGKVTRALAAEVLDRMGRAGEDGDPAPDGSS